MAQVTVRINGYSHPVSCQDGQEQHLGQLAAEVDRRIGAIKAQGAQYGEARMLLMAALVLADEVHDLKLDVERARAGQPPVAADGGEDARMAERLARIAEKIEGIATDLEHP